MPNRIRIQADPLCSLSPAALLVVRRLRPIHLLHLPTWQPWNPVASFVHRLPSTRLFLSFSPRFSSPSSPSPPAPMASSSASPSLFSPLSPLQTPSRSKRIIPPDRRLGFRRICFFPNLRALIPVPPPRNPCPNPIRAVQTDRVPSRSSNEGGGKEEDDPIERFLKRDYSQWGFVSDIESVSIPKGLDEGTIRLISAKKGEPDWMLQFRLRAFRRFLSMREPQWSDNRYPPIDLQSFCYYSEPKRKPKLGSLDEVDPKLLETFDRLGIPLNEQKRLANVAVDAVIDSTSIATTHRAALAEKGVIFCSISEAIREYPDLVRRYLGEIVPAGDNYYAALNSAVFSDGSFCYIPKDTVCPMEISTYFRINDRETGQFERTLIVADERSYVSYLEGCTAPSYDKNQLHAAVVELYCHEGAEIKYSTVQNWYAGDEQGNGGIYNFVTKRGLCQGKGSKISWTQVETGSAITWKYPSVILRGDDSVGEFYSVALTKDFQQADTGTKMIHQGKNTRSRIVSKGISAGKSRNCYRGLVKVQPDAENARNFSQCDSMLIGDTAGANTYPYIEVVCSFIAANWLIISS